MHSHYLPNNVKQFYNPLLGLQGNILVWFQDTLGDCTRISTIFIFLCVISIYQRYFKYDLGICVSCVFCFAVWLDIDHTDLELSENKRHIQRGFRHLHVLNCLHATRNENTHTHIPQPHTQTPTTPITTSNLVNNPTNFGSNYTFIF